MHRNLLIVKTILNLFFPKVCYACMMHLSDNEMDMCTQCRHQLPVTQFHFNDSPNIVNRFSGRAKIEQGTALFYFEKKGIVQQLIHNLKYKGHVNIGATLGDWLGQELSNLPSYNSIDIVMPVPLHPKRKRKRGYNQSAKFGQHIAKFIAADYIDDVLVKVTNATSQTAKRRVSRWQSNTSLFALKQPHKIANKHILLVDDIITTGATMEACITVLHESLNVKISIAAIAIA